MNASRAALMVVGVNLVAVWAAAAAGGRAAATEPAAPPQAAAVEAVSEARGSLLAAAERLEAHARREIAPAMVRDPFRFGIGSLPAARRAPDRTEAENRGDAAAAAANPVDAEPDIVLQGMAETADGEALVRTAILRAGGELVLASLGTRIGGRYEVVALNAESVDLEDTATHVRRTWRMK